MRRIDIEPGLVNKLYFHAKLSLNQVAQKVGVSNGVIERIFREQGWKWRTRAGKGRNRELLKLHKQGKSRCGKCRQIKAISDFSVLPRSWTGHSYRCKACDSKRYYKTAKQNPFLFRARNINAKAQSKFITSQDLQEIWQKHKGRCYYCEKELSIEIGPKHCCFDHVIPGLHRRDNLVLSCERCNMLKNAGSADEHETIAKKMRAHASTK